MVVKVLFTFSSSVNFFERNEAAHRNVPLHKQMCFCYFAESGLSDNAHPSTTRTPRSTPLSLNLSNSIGVVINTWAYFVQHSITFTPSPSFAKCRNCMTSPAVFLPVAVS